MESLNVEDLSDERSVASEGSLPDDLQRPPFTVGQQNSSATSGDEFCDKSVLVTCERSKGNMLPLSESATELVSVPDEFTIMDDLQVSKYAPLRNVLANSRNPLVAEQEDDPLHTLAASLEAELAMHEDYIPIQTESVMSRQTDNTDLLEEETDVSVGVESVEGSGAMSDNVILASERILMTESMKNGLPPIKHLGSKSQADVTRDDIVVQAENVVNGCLVNNTESSMEVPVNLRNDKDALLDKEMHFPGKQFHAKPIDPLHALVESLNEQLSRHSENDINKKAENMEVAGEMHSALVGVEENEDTHSNTELLFPEMPLVTEPRLSERSELAVNLESCTYLFSLPDKNEKDDLRVRPKPCSEEQPVAVRDTFKESVNTPIISLNNNLCSTTEPAYTGQKKDSSSPITEEFKIKIPLETIKLRRKQPTSNLNTTNSVFLPLESLNSFALPILSNKVSESFKVPVEALNDNQQISTESSSDEQLPSSGELCNENFSMSDQTLSGHLSSTSSPASVEHCPSFGTVLKGHARLPDKLLNSRLPILAKSAPSELLVDNGDALNKDSQSPTLSSNLHCMHDASCNSHEKFSQAKGFKVKIPLGTIKLKKQLNTSKCTSTSEHVANMELKPLTNINDTVSSNCYASNTSNEQLSPSEYTPKDNNEAPVEAVGGNFSTKTTCVESVDEQLLLSGDIVKESAEVSFEAFSDNLCIEATLTPTRVEEVSKQLARSEDILKETAEAPVEVGSDLCINTSPVKGEGDSLCTSAETLKVKIPLGAIQLRKTLPLPCCHQSNNVYLPCEIKSNTDQLATSNLFPCRAPTGICSTNVPSVVSTTVTGTLTSHIGIACKPLIPGSSSNVLNRNPSVRSERICNKRPSHFEGRSKKGVKVRGLINESVSFPVEVVSNNMCNMPKGFCVEQAQTNSSSSTEPFKVKIPLNFIQLKNNLQTPNQGERNNTHFNNNNNFNSSLNFSQSKTSITSSSRCLANSRTGKLKILDYHEVPFADNETCFSKSDLRLCQQIDLTKDREMSSVLKDTSRPWCNDSFLNDSSSPTKCLPTEISKSNLFPQTEIMKSRNQITMSFDFGTSLQSEAILYDDESVLNDKPKSRSSAQLGVFKEKSTLASADGSPLSDDTLPAVMAKSLIVPEVDIVKRKDMSSSPSNLTEPLQDEALLENLTPLPSCILPHTSKSSLSLQSSITRESDHSEIMSDESPVRLHDAAALQDDCSPHKSKLKSERSNSSLFPQNKFSADLDHSALPNSTSASLPADGSPNISITLKCLSSEWTEPDSSSHGEASSETQPSWLLDVNAPSLTDTLSNSIQLPADDTPPTSSGLSLSIEDEAFKNNSQFSSLAKAPLHNHTSPINCFFSDTLLPSSFTDGKDKASSSFPDNSFCNVVTHFKSVPSETSKSNSVSLTEIITEKGPCSPGSDVGPHWHKDVSSSNISISDDNSCSSLFSVTDQGQSASELDFSIPLQGDDLNNNLPPSAKALPRVTSKLRSISQTEPTKDQTQFVLPADLSSKLKEQNVSLHVKDPKDNIQPTLGANNHFTDADIVENNVNQSTGQSDASLSFHDAVILSDTKWQFTKISNSNLSAQTETTHGKDKSVLLPSAYAPVHDEIFQNSIPQFPKCLPPGSSKSLPEIVSGQDLRSETLSISVNTASPTDTSYRLSPATTYFPKENSKSHSSPQTEITSKVHEVNLPLGIKRPMCNDTSSTNLPSSVKSLPAESFTSCLCPQTEIMKDKGEFALPFDIIASLPGAALSNKSSPAVQDRHAAKSSFTVSPQAAITKDEDQINLPLAAFTTLSSDTLSSKLSPPDKHLSAETSSLQNEIAKDKHRLTTSPSDVNASLPTDILPHSLSSLPKCLPSEVSHCNSSTKAKIGKDKGQLTPLPGINAALQADTTANDLPQGVQGPPVDLSRSIFSPETQNTEVKDQLSLPHENGASLLNDSNVYIPPMKSELYLSPENKITNGKDQLTLSVGLSSSVSDGTDVILSSHALPPTECLSTDTPKSSLSSDSEMIAVKDQFTLPSDVGAVSCGNILSSNMQPAVKYTSVKTSGSSRSPENKITNDMDQCTLPPQVSSCLPSDNVSNNVSAPDNCLPSNSSGSSLSSRTEVTKERDRYTLPILPGEILSNNLLPSLACLHVEKSVPSQVEITQDSDQTTLSAGCNPALSGDTSSENLLYSPKPLPFEKSNILPQDEDTDNLDQSVFTHDINSTLSGYSSSKILSPLVNSSVSEISKSEVSLQTEVPEGKDQSSVPLTSSSDFPGDSLSNKLPGPAECLNTETPGSKLPPQIETTKDKDKPITLPAKTTPYNYRPSAKSFPAEISDTNIFPQCTRTQDADHFVVTLDASLPSVNQASPFNLSPLVTCSTSETSKLNVPSDTEITKDEEQSILLSTMKNSLQDDTLLSDVPSPAKGLPHERLESSLSPQSEVKESKQSHVPCDTDTPIPGNAPPSESKKFKFCQSAVTHDAHLPMVSQVSLSDLSPPAKYSPSETSKLNVLFDTEVNENREQSALPMNVDALLPVDTLHNDVSSTAKSLPDERSDLSLCSQAEIKESIQPVAPSDNKTLFHGDEPSNNLQSPGKFLSSELTKFDLCQQSNKDKDQSTSPTDNDVPLCVDVLSDSKSVWALFSPSKESQVLFSSQEEMADNKDQSLVPCSFSSCVDHGMNARNGSLPSVHLAQQTSTSSFSADTDTADHNNQLNLPLFDDNTKSPPVSPKGCSPDTTKSSPELFQEAEVPIKTLDIETSSNNISGHSSFLDDGQTTEKDTTSPTSCDTNIPGNEISPSSTVLCEEEVLQALGTLFLPLSDEESGEGEKVTESSHKKMNESELSPRPCSDESTCSADSVLEESFSMSNVFRNAMPLPASFFSSRIPRNERESELQCKSPYVSAVLPENNTKPLNFAANLLRDKFRIMNRYCGSSVSMVMERQTVLLKAKPKGSAKRKLKKQIRMFDEMTESLISPPTVSAVESEPLCFSSTPRKRRHGDESDEFSTKHRKNHLGGKSKSKDIADQDNSHVKDVKVLLDRLPDSNLGTAESTDPSIARSLCENISADWKVSHDIDSVIQNHHLSEMVSVTDGRNYPSAVLKLKALRLLEAAAIRKREAGKPGSIQNESPIKSKIDDVLPKRRFVQRKLKLNVVKNCKDRKYDHPLKKSDKTSGSNVKDNNFWNESFTNPSVDGSCNEIDDNDSVSLNEGGPTTLHNTATMTAQTVKERSTPGFRNSNNISSASIDDTNHTRESPAKGVDDSIFCRTELVETLEDHIRDFHVKELSSTKSKSILHRDRGNRGRPKKKKRPSRVKFHSKDISGTPVNISIATESKLEHSNKELKSESMQDNNVAKIKTDRKMSNLLNIGTNQITDLKQPMQRNLFSNTYHFRQQLKVATTCPCCSQVGDKPCVTSSKVSSSSVSFAEPETNKHTPVNSNSSFNSAEALDELKTLNKRPDQGSLHEVYLISKDNILKERTRSTKAKSKPELISKIVHQGNSGKSDVDLRPVKAHLVESDSKGGKLQSDNKIVSKETGGQSSKTDQNLPAYKQKEYLKTKGKPQSNDTRPAEETNRQSGKTNQNPSLSKQANSLKTNLLSHSFKFNNVFRGRLHNVSLVSPHNILKRRTRSVKAKFRPMSNRKKLYLRSATLALKGRKPLKEPLGSNSSIHDASKCFSAAYLVPVPEMHEGKVKASKNVLEPQMNQVKSNRKHASSVTMNSMKLKTAGTQTAVYHYSTRMNTELGIERLSENISTLNNLSHSKRHKRSVGMQVCEELSTQTATNVTEMKKEPNATDDHCYSKEPGIYLEAMKELTNDKTFRYWFPNHGFTEFCSGDLSASACKECAATSSLILVLFKELQQHIKTIHSEFHGYQCQSCTHSFRSPSDLSNHLICRVLQDVIAMKLSRESQTRKGTSFRHGKVESESLSVDKQEKSVDKGKGMNTVNHQDSEKQAILGGQSMQEQTSFNSCTDEQDLKGISGVIRTRNVVASVESNEKENQPMSEGQKVFKDKTKLSHPISHTQNVGINKMTLRKRLLEQEVEKASHVKHEGGIDIVSKVTAGEWQRDTEIPKHHTKEFKRARFSNDEDANKSCKRNILVPQVTKGGNKKPFFGKTSCGELKEDLRRTSSRLLERSNASQVKVEIDLSKTSTPLSEKSADQRIDQQKCIKTQSLGRKNNSTVKKHARGEDMRKLRARSFDESINQQTQKQKRTERPETRMSQKSSTSKTETLNNEKIAHWCKKCGKWYYKLSDLKRHHAAVHKSDSVKCYKCKKHFASDILMAKHIFQEHSALVKKGTKNSTSTASKRKLKVRTEPKETIQQKDISPPAETSEKQVEHQVKTVQTGSTELKTKLTPSQTNDMGKITHKSSNGSGCTSVSGGTVQKPRGLKILKPVKQPAVHMTEREGQSKIVSSSNNDRKLFKCLDCPLWFSSRLLRNKHYFFKHCSNANGSDGEQASEDTTDNNRSFPDVRVSDTDKKTEEQGSDVFNLERFLIDNYAVQLPKWPKKEARHRDGFKSSGNNTAMPQFQHMPSMCKSQHVPISQIGTSLNNISSIAFGKPESRKDGTTSIDGKASTSNKDKLQADIISSPKKVILYTLVKNADDTLQSKNNSVQWKLLGNAESTVASSPSSSTQLVIQGTSVNLASNDNTVLKIQTTTVKDSTTGNSIVESTKSNEQQTLSTKPKSALEIVSGTHSKASQILRIKPMDTNGAPFVPVDAKLKQVLNIKSGNKLVSASSQERLVTRNSSETSVPSKVEQIVKVNSNSLPKLALYAPSKAEQMINTNSNGLPKLALCLQSKEERIMNTNPKNAMVTIFHTQSESEQVVSMTSNSMSKAGLPKVQQILSSQYNSRLENISDSQSRSVQMLNTAPSNSLETVPRALSKTEPVVSKTQPADSSSMFSCRQLKAGIPPVKSMNAPELISRSQLKVAEILNIKPKNKLELVSHSLLKAEKPLSIKPKITPEVVSHSESKVADLLNIKPIDTPEVVSPVRSIAAKPLNIKPMNTPEAVSRAQSIVAKPLNINPMNTPEVVSCTESKVAESSNIMAKSTPESVSHTQSKLAEPIKIKPTNTQSKVAEPMNTPEVVSRTESKIAEPKDILKVVSQSKVAEPLNMKLKKSIGTPSLLPLKTGQIFDTTLESKAKVTSCTQSKVGQISKTNSTSRIDVVSHIHSQLKQVSNTKQDHKLVLHTQSKTAPTKQQILNAKGKNTVEIASHTSLKAEQLSDTKPVNKPLEFVSIVQPKIHQNTGEVTSHTPSKTEQISNTKPVNKPLEFVSSLQPNICQNAPEIACHTPSKTDQISNTKTVNKSLESVSSVKPKIHQTEQPSVKHTHTAIFSVRSEAEQKLDTVSKNRPGPLPHVQSKVEHISKTKPKNIVKAVGGAQTISHPILNANAKNKGKVVSPLKSNTDEMSNTDQKSSSGPASHTQPNTQQILNTKSEDGLEINQRTKSKANKILSEKSKDELETGPATQTTRSKDKSERVSNVKLKVTQIQDPKPKLLPLTPTESKTDIELKVEQILNRKPKLLSSAEDPKNRDCPQDRSVNSSRTMFCNVLSVSASNNDVRSSGVNETETIAQRVSQTETGDAHDDRDLNRGIVYRLGAGRNVNTKTGENMKESDGGLRTSEENVSKSVVDTVTTKFNEVSEKAVISNGKEKVEPLVTSQMEIQRHGSATTKSSVKIAHSAIVIKSRLNDIVGKADGTAGSKS